MGRLRVAQAHFQYFVSAPPGPEALPDDVLERHFENVKVSTLTDVGLLAITPAGISRASDQVLHWVILRQRTPHRSRTLNAMESAPCCPNTIQNQSSASLDQAMAGFQGILKKATQFCAQRDSSTPSRLTPSAADPSRSPSWFGRSHWPAQRCSGNARTKQSFADL